MEWMNIHVSVIDSAEFKGAEPVDQATWLKLFRFCCGQENGGVIEKAETFTERQWWAVGCTREEGLRTCFLWSFEKGDLILNFYNHDSEKVTRAKRRGGRIGNLRKHGKKKACSTDSDTDSDTHVVGPTDVDSGPDSASITKRNETKRNETTGAAVAEIPSESRVLDVARNYPGDLARGIPAVIPEGWALSWFAWRLTPAAGPFPADWVGDLTRRFRSGWVNGDPRTRGASGKNSEKTATVSASVEAIAKQKQAAVLQAELRELEQEIESLVQAGAAVPLEKTEREKEIRKQMSV